MDRPKKAILVPFHRQGRLNLSLTQLDVNRDSLSSTTLVNEALEYRYRLGVVSVAKCRVFVAFQTDAASNGVRHIPWTPRMANSLNILHGHLAHWNSVRSQSFVAHERANQRRRFSVDDIN